MTLSDQIKSRLDIVDVLQEYLPELKQAGKSWKSPCPFHEEKTPSFFVSPEKQIWHCFGCSKGGSIFNFVMEMEKIEFKDALKILARKAGIELKKEDQQIQTQRNRLINICQDAVEFFYQFLLKSLNAKIGRQYLKSRKITIQSIKDFKIGCAPNSWHELTKFLNKKGYSENEIIAAGLAIRSQEKASQAYDRFRNRLMFPISNVFGEIVGFSGRILESKDDSEAKYINTPQTLIYNKGQILYGLDKAKETIRKEKTAIIVEGNMDVLMSHQIGIKNVIASSGTALTLDQIKLLKRFTHSFVLAFDEDQAGQEATKRGIDLINREEIDAKIISLSQGKDPDEIIRKDPELWKQAIKKAKRIIDFYFDQTLKNRDLTMLNVEEKKQIAKELLFQIIKIGDKVEQTHYLQKLANILDVSEKTLREEMMKKVYPVKFAPQLFNRVNPVKFVSQSFNRASKENKEENFFLEKNEEIYHWPFFLVLKFPQQIEMFLNNLEEKYFLSETHQALYKFLKEFYNKNLGLSVGKLKPLLQAGRLEPLLQPNKDESEGSHLPITESSHPSITEDSHLSITEGSHLLITNEKKNLISFKPNDFRKFLKEKDEKLSSFLDILEIEREKDFEKKHQENLKNSTYADRSKWIEKEIKNSIKRIKVFFYKKKLEEKEIEIKKAENKKEKEKFKKLLEEFKEISLKLSEN